MTKDIPEKLKQECPESVMVRVILENALPAEEVDKVFEENRSQQYTRELLFSSVVKLAQLVVCRVRPSMHAAFKLLKDDLPVSERSLYNKLNNTELSVCESLVQSASDRMRPVVDALKTQQPQIISGYETRIIDGNHLAATEHRIKELRRIASGPLPGKSMVVWDAERQMVHRVYCCEDGHAQERSILPRVLEDVQPGELWMGDRNIATASFVWEVRQSKAHFIVRRHATNIRLEAIGEERVAGETDTGMVFEQAIEIKDDFGGAFRARLVRVELNTPTRDKDHEIQILTNLPKNVSARKVAEAYLQRWQIETAFYELDALFEGEIASLGHPRAALLMFCLSLIAFNSLCLVRNALAAAHGDAKADEVSSYYFVHLVNADWRALEIFTTCEEWAAAYAKKSPAVIARALKSLAKNVDLKRLKKSKRGPKKKPPKRASAKGKPHVSTHRVLQARTKAK